MSDQTEYARASNAKPERKSRQREREAQARTAGGQFTGPGCQITPEIFDCAMREVRTGRALRGVLQRQQVHPDHFYQYIDSNSGAAEQYARARAASLDAMAEEAVGIADDPTIPSDHKRVMVDTRRWFLSKLAPKRYGDHLELTVGSSSQAMAMTRDELLSLVVDKAKRIQAPVEGEQESDGADLTRTNVHQEGE
jgi:hypothetical protein